MPKKFLKRYMPSHEKVRNHKHLKVFGTLLHSQNLWHMNRRSVAGAFANGLFMAFVPVPFQMLLAAGAAIIFSVNLPISVALVWLTNPLTIPPMFYGAYRIGAWLMDLQPRNIQFELTMEWITSSLAVIWQPFLLGCFVCGVLFSIIGYVSIRLIWRLHVVAEWKKRRQRKIVNKP